MLGSAQFVPRSQFHELFASQRRSEPAAGSDLHGSVFDIAGYILVVLAVVAAEPHRLSCSEPVAVG